jgi:probable HAF family extracellular repeat protein
MKLSIFQSRAGRLASGLTSLVVAFSFLSFSLPSAAGQAQFTSLGSLFAGGSSFANGVSADGGAVVGVSNYFDPANPANDRSVGYIWTATGGMVDLGRIGPEGATSAAFRVSSGGSVVVGWAENNTGAQEIFRWTPSTGMVGTGLSGFGSVSDDGNVFVANNVDEAARWTEASGATGLGVPAGFASSSATDVSSDGSVITGNVAMPLSGGGVALVPYRWTAASGIVPFTGYPETDITNRLAVSPDGTVIVGSLALRFGPETAFKWTLAGGLEFIPDAGGLDTAALGIAGDNATIVGFRRAPGGANQAAIWDASGDMRLLQDVLTADYGLDLTGWTLARATDISADGRTIVGNGINPLGFQEAWLVQLPTAVPVPAAVWLFGSGLLGLAGVARKKKQK